MLLEGGLKPLFDAKDAALLVVVAFAVWREYENARMIRSLMDRLMSRNLYEYKRGTNAAPKSILPQYRPGMSDEELAMVEEDKKANV